MLLECKRCGAPLDGRGVAPILKCNYCGTSDQREALPVQQAFVPVGWRPPQTWVAPPHFGYGSQSFDYTPAATGIRMMGVLFGVVPAIVIALVGVGAAVTSRSSSGSGSGSAPSGIAADDGWDGKTTFRCGGTEGHTLSNFNAKLDVAIDAQNICKVEVKDSDLEGSERTIVAEHASTIILRGGTLRADHTAIVARGGAKVELHNVHVIVGGGFASLRASGELVAIDAADGSKVDLYDCTIDMVNGDMVNGDKADEAFLVKAGGLAHVNFHSGKATGKFTVRAQAAANVTAHGTDVKGRIDVSTSAKVQGVKNTSTDCKCAHGDKACKRWCRKK